MAKRAETVRLESLERLLQAPNLQQRTKTNMQIINDACARMTERREDLTVAALVRFLRKEAPEAAIAEQTFYNKTPSGACYREVVAIWDTYRLAISRVSLSRSHTPVHDDLPDVILNQLLPESARVVVLAMRTSLRNTRRQITMLRSMTPDKLVRHISPGTPLQPVAPASLLSKEERSILKAFIDKTEASSRDAEWDDIGRIIVNDEPISRPGLRQAIEKVLAADEPSLPTDKAAPKKKASK